jgi:polyisoprenoid-binding protein YceI
MSRGSSGTTRPTLPAPLFRTARKAVLSFFPGNPIITLMHRLLLLLLLPLAARAAVETYHIDPNHSSVVFNVRHFLAKVPGTFARFTGTLTVDRDDFTRNSITAAVQIGGIDTKNEARDKHLRSADFFLAEQFPDATFRSTSWKKSGPDTYTVTGELTIRGQTRPLVLEVKFLGFADGQRGAKLSGWEAVTTIDRTDFGVGVPEKSIADEVELSINIEAKLQQPDAPKAP